MTEIGCSFSIDEREREREREREPVSGFWHDKCLAQDCP